MNDLPIMLERKPHIVLCPFCLCRAKLVKHKRRYMCRSTLRFVCPTCEASTGVEKHLNYLKPFGPLTNPSVRLWRKKAHVHFDGLWKEMARFYAVPRAKARQDGYLWLSKKLDIPMIDCHISLFNKKECQQVIRFCAPLLKIVKRIK